MSQKVLKIPIKSTEHYLQLFGGLISLTDKEREITARLIEYYMEIKDLKIPINLLSPEVKKRVAEQVGLKTPYQLNMYILILRDKGVLQKKGETEIINPIIIPQQEDQLIFKLVYET